MSSAPVVLIDSDPDQEVVQEEGISDEIPSSGQIKTARTSQRGIATEMMVAMKKIQNHLW